MSNQKRPRTSNGHSVRVNLAARSYDIRVGRGIITHLGDWLKETACGKDPFIVTNHAILGLCREKVEESLRKAGFNAFFHVIPDSETSKSLSGAEVSLRSLARFDTQKETFVIALGGGVVGDLAGFIASIYKRGIPYVQVPTTLLAQVDSAIGGKTGVDLPEGKNLVGSFYQPRLVVSDTSFISTLEARQVRSGLAEVIKYAAISDAELFEWIEQHLHKVLALEPEALERVVLACSRMKAKLVSKDERDVLGERMLLNFGHTIGHAIEAAGKYRLHNHGEAIALGMLVAADISARVSLVDSSVGGRLKELLVRVGLPVVARGISSKHVLDAHYRDKKFIGERNRFVLLGAIGKAQVQENIPLDIVTQSLKIIFS